MTRSRLIVVALGVALVAAVAGYVVYDQVLRGDSVAVLTLPTASPGATRAASSATPAAASSATPAAGSSADPAGGPTTAPSAAPGSATGEGVAGTWTVTTGSQAGYRVRERLANLPAESDAVGRTSQVSGSITLDASPTTTTLTGGTITVDTTSLTSDKSQRDNRLRTEGLQTDRFPTATFTLTAPVDIPAAALTGTAADVTLTGDLTLHGVTKSVRIPAQAQLADGTIQVAGSITFPLSDYAITAPNIGGFIVSIADTGTLEFLVAFSRG
jgi:polyisoprenoid-binding protein YceI